MQDASLGGSMLGYYDFGARFYNPMYGRWFNMDPARQFENPFTYCANNPINAIDPDGREIYMVNEWGDIVDTRYYADGDMFVSAEQINGVWMAKWGKDEDGRNRVIQEEFPKDVVDVTKWKVYGPMVPDGRRQDRSVSIDGDYHGTRMFEFLANNTKVEWSHLKTGTEYTGTNYLTSSREEATDRAAGPFVDNLVNSNTNIREMSHNHPGNTEYPSGSWDDKDGGKAGTWGDVNFARWVTDALQKKGLSPPQFSIYLPGSGMYIFYDAKSKYTDYVPTKK